MFIFLVEIDSILVSHRITLEIKKKYCFVDKVDDCTKFMLRYFYIQQDF